MKIEYTDAIGTKIVVEVEHRPDNDNVDDGQFSLVFTENGNHEESYEQNYFTAKDMFGDLQAEFERSVGIRK